MAKDFLLHRISYEKKREEVYRWAHGLFGCFCLAVIVIPIAEAVETVAVTVVIETETVTGMAAAAVIIETEAVTGMAVVITIITAETVTGIVAVRMTIPDSSRVLIPDHLVIGKPVAVKTKNKGKGILLGCPFYMTGPCICVAEGQTFGLQLTNGKGNDKLIFIQDSYNGNYDLEA